MDALPNELRQLEEELIASRSSEPSTELRDRVLGEVQHALAVELRASRRQSRWAFAVSVAASVLVWMNMAISASPAPVGSTISVIKAGIEPDESDEV